LDTGPGAGFTPGRRAAKFCGAAGGSRLLMARTSQLMKSLLPLALALLAVTGCQKTDSAAAPAPGPAKAYPLDVCLVSGEKLGSMGDPIVITHAGQEVKFCCKSCQPDFAKDPAKYLAKLAGK
jgi:YHS domain-containing protein